MSEHAPPTATTDDSVNLETGLEALRSSPEFRGPVEPLDDHDHAHGHANNHFALIYESQEEQFAAAIPFIRQGLDRGERCLYITYENSRKEVEAAMREYGIGVDAALASGQLSIHDEQETYLRNASFDADETIEFIDAAVEEATEEFKALRMAGEMSSVLEEDPKGEELVRCEAKANYLFDEVDGLALCQYNRNRFPADVIRDVISTHPILVQSGRVSHNVYYTPPEEFFAPDKTEREVDRLLGSLEEQTDAKAELHHRERFLRESYRITSDPDLDFEEKLDALFDLGCEWFDLDLGGLAKVDPDEDRFEVEYVSDDHGHLVPGAQADLTETYCRVTTEGGSGDSVADPVAVTDPIGDGFEDKLCYEQFGVRTYLGSYLDVEDAADRTFWFVSNTPRDEEFSEAEHTFHNLMGQWVKYELERRQRERELRERTEHLGALVETTPECITTVAPDGTLLQMNATGLDMVEAPAESAVVGEYVYDLIAPEHRERFREFNERVCRGERGTLEFDIIGLEGTRRHMETHAAPLQRSDGTTVQVALTRDITDRTERERELERVLDLLEKTERIADVGGWEIDVETQDVFWTDHIFELLEVPGDEEPPLDEALAMYHEDDRSIVEDAVETALDTGESFDVEARIRTATDEVRWLRVQGVSEVADGEVVSLRGAAQDITEQKERERELDETITELQESEERVQLALKAGEMGTWELDLQTGDAPVHSPQHDRIFGYEEPLDDWDFETFLDHVHPDDREQVEQRFEDAFETGKWDFECRITGADGERRVISAQGEFYDDSEGMPVRGVGVVQDVTEQKEREAELRQTKTRFETVFEQSDDAIFILDPEADVLVDANPAAAEMTGYTPDELLSVCPSDLHPDELEQFRAFLDEVREIGSGWSEDFHCRHKDGRDVPAEITASTITLDGRSLILANVRPIEDRKTHERYQRDLYTIIADHEAPAAEKFERMLELGCERFDLPVGMLTHKREEAFEITKMRGDHPNLDEGTLTPPLTDNYCRRVVDTGEPVSVADAGAAGWEGDALYHEFGLACYAGVQLTVGDEPYGTICFTDLSPRETEFTEAEETFLELMGQCVSYELERNQREVQLEDKNDRLESFASMLAHELRNPVAIGQIYSQQLPAETDVEAVDYIAEAFDRIEDMIDVMLVLTRGREAIGERTPVALGDASRDAWTDVDPSDATLNVELDATIEADETYIQHLFCNLLENAVEHAGPDVTVTVGSLKDGFYVADDGPGIPATDRDAIFDEGYTTAAESGGSGLGLAFVQKLADVYEWQCEVTESAAGGARFEVRNVF